jgi:ferrous iron transport protein A
MSQNALKLSDLPDQVPAVVIDVVDQSPGDVIGQRLRELGFVRDEPVRVVGRGPVGADPLLIQIGFTRFALRRSEAARVSVARVN